MPRAFSHSNHRRSLEESRHSGVSECRLCVSIGRHQTARNATMRAEYHAIAPTALRSLSADAAAGSPEDGGAGG